MLRPRPARWFEALCPRGDSARITGVLARTGAVETEIRAVRQGELRLQELDKGLAEYRALLPRYARYWRRGELSHLSISAPPREIMSRALAQLRDWQQQVDPLIERLQELEDERHRIGMCHQVMDALAGYAVDFTRLNAIGPCLDRVAAILPEPMDLPPLEEAILHLAIPLDEGQAYLLAVGPADTIASLTDRIRTMGGRLLQPPPWLRGDPRNAKGQIEQRIGELEQEIERIYLLLDRLFQANGLEQALGDLTCLEWFTANVGVLELTGERFALVTGWTSSSAEELADTLRQNDSPALIRFPPPPAGSTPPQLMDNPPWARPFEVLVRALGMPGAAEADPSALLALVVPLLFGYMFGDLGQGLVILAVGWVLRERFALARLLMAAGASAALFGLVFGSLFGVEHVIPALWLHPLEHPITVLAAPLGFAVLLLTLGQLLNAAEAAWRGELRHWLWTDAGFLLLYLGTVSSLLQPELYWLALLGAAWLLLGSAHLGGALHALAALGELLERGLQILVNTLSFARVGAFALAHAGLSSAMLSLADAAGGLPGWLAVMLLGNLLIILLEGLVVSIQTTRLVLFEFFVRFLEGKGREFRPLPVPPSFVQGDQQ
jgi:V/A-type H+-transporting ATPase subunit I